MLTAYGQSDLDSLKSVIETTTDDSVKSNSLIELALKLNNSSEALDYAIQALELAEKGGYNVLAGQVSTSLGIMYYQLGDYESCLDYFYKAESFNAQLNDKITLARSYNNLGLILSELGRMEETIRYHKLSLEIKTELNDVEGQATSYSNLGLAYDESDSLSLAMDYYRKAQSIYEDIDDSYGLYIVYSNIGKNHFKRENYDSTELYYNKAIMLTDKIENKYNKSELLRDYAALDLATKEYDRALEKYKSSLRIARQIQAKQLISDAYLGLSNVYKAMNQPAIALSYYVQFDSLKDILFNEQQSKKIADIERNYQIQKGQKEIELLKKEAEIKDLSLRNNQFLTYLLVFILILIGIIVFLQFRKNTFKTKTNQILMKQNQEIADKNRDITDSIYYAKSIQKAIIPSGKKLKEYFPDAFVYSKARDIVNGDFYWFVEIDNKVLVAAVDCTGHGVPAAFLNVIGNLHLNSITEENFNSPASILEDLNSKVIQSMRGNQVETHVDDGMDIALCLFDKKTHKLAFSGAKRPLYCFQGDELVMVKGDSKPVGGKAYGNERTYKEHVVQLSKGDSFYLFTDGLVDQFGGAKNKKFMYFRLRDFLKTNHKKDMETQRALLIDKFTEWKGSNQQTDDILFLGMRV